MSWNAMTALTNGFISLGGEWGGDFAIYRVEVGRKSALFAFAIFEINTILNDDVVSIEEQLSEAGEITTRYINSIVNKEIYAFEYYPSNFVRVENPNWLRSPKPREIIERNQLGRIVNSSLG